MRDCGGLLEFIWVGSFGTSGPLEPASGRRLSRGIAGSPLSQSPPLRLPDATEPT